MASPSKLRRSVRTSKQIVRLSINDAVLKKPTAKRKTVVGTTKTPAPPAPSRKTTVGTAKVPAPTARKTTVGTTKTSAPPAPSRKTTLGDTRASTAKTVATPSKTVTSVRVTTKGADEEKSEKEKTVKGPPNNAARRATRTAKNDEKKEDEKKAAPSTVRRGPIKAYPDEPKIAAAAAATAAGDNGETEGYKVLVNLGVMRDLCKQNFVYPDRRMVEIIVDKKNVNLLG